MSALTGISLQLLYIINSIIYGKVFGIAKLLIFTQLKTLKEAI